MNLSLPIRHSYTARLNRLKQGAGETLALLGDEFEEQLSPEDFGFVDPSSYSDSGVGSENNNPRSANSGGGGGRGLDAPEADRDDDGGEGADAAAAAAVPVGEGDDVLLVVGGGGEEGIEAAADKSAGLPVSRPMNLEEPAWDAQGDCIPLPAWKVLVKHVLHGRHTGVYAVSWGRA